MKKLVFAVLAFCAVCACVSSDANTIRPDWEYQTPKMEMLYSYEIERAIDVVYDGACQYLDATYDSVATDEWKLFIIREADMKDEAGDVIPEIPEYDEIYDMLWPAGYPKE